MADIQYLNYGDQQIEQQALLNNLANQVQGYVQNQSWSKKRKEKFMSAYSDLMNRGILGASNNSGQWVIDVNGDPIPFDTMDKKDKEMYQEAAYFIQQQMAGLPTKASQEEKAEEDKSKLPLFDNAYFTRELGNHISNNMFGGREIDTQTDWNSLDERGENGLRGTNKRAEALANMLQSYSDSLEEGKHNFEGSPFKDLSDFKTKVGTAISALRDGAWDQKDTDALNAIGLRSSDWFNNGSGDNSGKVDAQGNPLTYAQLGEYNQAVQEQKAKEEETKQQQAQKAAYDNTLFFTRGSAKLQGRTPQQLKQKYGADDKLRQALFQYSQSDIRRLTPDEQSEIHGAYRYLADAPIDNKLLKQLQSSSSGLYKNAPLSRFKKINGIDGLIWDSYAGQVIQIRNREQYNANNNAPKDLFAGLKSDKEKEQEFLNSKIPGITNAEWKELSAIGLDIASILDPEAISGSGLALTAAGLRHSAKNDSNPNWSAGDYFWQGVDYLTGALGGIQVVGDAMLGVKTMQMASKALPIFRKLARVGAWADLYQAYPGLKDATNKIINGEELTVGDWRAIGQGLRGLVSHGRLNRQNLGERQVIEQSGYSPEQVSSMRGRVRDWTNRAGFTRTKMAETATTPTVKVKLNGSEKEVEIPVSQKAKAKIQEEVRKAGNDATKRNQAVEKVLKDKELMGEQALPESDKVSVVEPTKMDSRFVPQRLGTTDQIFGSRTESSSRGVDNFEDWLAKRDYWSKLKYGSNRELIATRNRLGIENSAPIETTPPAQQQSQQTQVDYFPEGENDNIIRTLNNAFTPPQSKLTRTSRWITPKNSQVEGKLIDGNNYQVKFGKDANGQEEMFVILNGNSSKLPGKTLGEQKQALGKWIQEQNNRISQAGNLKLKTTDENWKNFVKSIKELKRKGYLFKQGGIITDQQIDNFLKQYK